MSENQPLTLLVVTCHPADAFDLASGTIARHVQMGDQVEIASVTHGARSHAPNVYDDRQESLDDAAEEALLAETIEQKKREFEAAAKAVGVTRTSILPRVTTRLPLWLPMLTGTWTSWQT